MKKILLSLLCATCALAYQPAAPAPVFLTSPPDLQPARVVAIVPAVIIGAVVVGGVAWGGIKIINKVLDIWEHKITNGPPEQIRFTFAEDEYPE